MSLLFSLLIAIIYSPQAQAAEAAHFSGGVCASQGNWIQQALDQSSTIVSAINTLKDDPNCKVLVSAIENTTELKTLSHDSKIAEGDSQNFGGFFRELQAINEYMGMQKNVNSPLPWNGQMAQTNKPSADVLRYLVFRKTLDATTQVKMQNQVTTMNPVQKVYYDNMSAQMQSFLRTAKRTADVTTSTTRSILSALPQSQLCLQNQPSTALTIFTALVNSGAALATGGEFTQLGPLMASIINFNRENSFMKNLKLVEYERYKAAVSCLVESTSESYCALRDAEDALDFFKGNNSKSEAKNVSLDPRENPMAGMIVMLRDLPIIAGWFQKILFGIDPKLKVEADMKNNNWDSILSFIKQLNSLPATFRDLKQVYVESTQGAAVDVKQAQVKELISQLIQIMSANQGSINFFNQAINEDLIPFYLMGQDKFPEGFNPKMKPFSAFYSEWTRTGEKGLDKPDDIVETIENRISLVMEKANGQSSNYFSQRMVVDSQNLITEGMVGPNISPYRALGNVDAYFKALAQKLKESRDQLEREGRGEGEIVAIDVTITMLEDSIQRIDSILNGMKEVAKLKGRGDFKTSRDGARAAMNVIYEFANMLISRDSFIGTRTVTAVRMDITDTLRKNENLSEAQRDLLLVLGKDIITRLSRYFSEDPVIQRLDVSGAMPIAEANLQAVDNLFAGPIYNSILELQCKLKGKPYCAEASKGYNPVNKGWFGQLLDNFNLPSRFGIGHWFDQPTSDSQSDENLVAKLCVQSLAFKDRGKFEWLCRGSKLTSEYSAYAKNKGETVDVDYNEALKNIIDRMKGNEPGRLTAAKSAGVCALRTYIRKNHIFRMYWSYQDE